MEFEVIRSNRKSMAVEIKLNKLIIRAPMQASNEEINSFMLKNKAWIEKHLAKAAAQQQFEINDLNGAAAAAKAI